MFPCKCLNLNLVHYTVHTACLNTFLQSECYHEEFLSQQSPIWQNLGILNNFLQYKLQPAQADSCWKSSVGKPWWSDDNVCVKRMLKSFSLCFDKTKSLLTYSNMPTPRLLVAQGEQGQRGCSVEQIFCLSDSLIFVWLGLVPVWVYGPDSGSEISLL